MPDLAVEVRSPSTWRYDVGVKKSTYERGWVPGAVAGGHRGGRARIPRSRSDAPTFDDALELGRPDELTSPLMSAFAVHTGELFPTR